MKQIYFSFFLMLAFISISNAQPGFEPDTIIVSPGWNLIGSTVTGAVSDIITTEPQGIITSPFWKFTPGGNYLLAGYSMADTLKKAFGYWVKIGAPGFVFVRPILPPIWICGNPFFGRIWYGDKWYHTVKIGTQCWLKSNLDIGVMRDGSEPQTDNGVIEKYCYGDDVSNCSAFGGLYKWDEAMQYVTTPGTQGICPNGWHIPTWFEFEDLKTIVGSDGNSLKSVGEGSGYGEGTNTSGFSALLAGYNEYSFFYSMHSRAKFWSSSLFGSDYAWSLTLNYDDDDIDILSFEDERNYNALSIRCIKN